MTMRSFIQLCCMYALLAVLGCADEAPPIGSGTDATVSIMNDQMVANDDSQVSVDMDLNADAALTDTEQTPSGPSAIQRIQQGALTDGTSVTITNAVVTAIAGSDGFFISDGTDLPFSGVYVYHPNTQSLGLQVGHTVTLVGVVKEYFDLTEVFMNSDAEVRIEGMSFVPEAVSVGADTLCDAAAIEPWEGMLISVDNVVVQSIGELGGFVVSTRNGVCEMAVRPLIAVIELGRLFRDQNIAKH